MSFQNPFNTYYSTPLSSSSSIGHNGYEVSLSFVSGIPDINIISDSQLRVLFSRMLKRDMTTKEKALKELKSFLDTTSESESNQRFDSLVLIPWIQLYPKLSLEVSRNVRVLSHEIQGLLCKIKGKKFKSYLKDSIGSWIAGTYDTDNIVSKAASNSLDQCFSTPQKKDGLLIVFHTVLLLFVENAISNETQTTLSDERYIGKPESEAKLNRLMTSAVSIFSKLVKVHLIKGSKINSEQHELYANIIQSSKIWDFLASSDSNLSKATLELLNSLLNIHDSNFSFIDQVLEKIAAILLQKRLKLSTSIKMAPIVIPTLKSLYALEKRLPTIWSITLPGKKKNSPVKCFLDFVSIGSCYARSDYWINLDRVLNTLPNEDFDKYLDSLWKGVTLEKSSIVEAYSVYFSLLTRALEFSSDHTFIVNRLQIAVEFAIKLRIPRKSELDKLLHKLVDTIDLFYKKFTPEVIQIWKYLSQPILKYFSTISKADSNYEYTSRFIYLSKLLESKDDKFHETISITIIPIIDQSLQPSSFETCTSFTLHTINNLLKYFPKLISSKYVELDIMIVNSLPNHSDVNNFKDAVSLLETYSSLIEDDVPAVRESITSLVTKSHKDEENFRAYTKILFNMNIKEVKLSNILEGYFRILGSISLADPESSNELLIISGLTKNNNNLVQQNDISSLLNTLFLTSIADETEDLFSKFFLTINIENNGVHDFISSESGNSFLLYLWKSIQNGEEVENQVIDVLTKNPKLGNNSIINIVFQSLKECITSGATDKIDLIATKTLSIYKNLGEDSSELLKTILFSKKEWESVINTALQSNPDSLLCISNPLEDGFLCAIKEKSNFSFEDSIKCILMARYVMKLLISDDSLFLKIDFQSDLIVAFQIIGEIANNFGFLGSKDESSTTVLDEMLDIKSNSLKILHNKLYQVVDLKSIISLIDDNIIEDGIASQVLKSLIEQAKENSGSKSAYSAMVLKGVISDFSENESGKSFENIISKCNLRKLTKFPLLLSSLILGFRKFLNSSITLDRLRNYVASELIGIEEESITTRGLEFVTLLNLLLPASTNEGDQFGGLPVNRLQMVVSKLKDFTESANAYDPGFTALRVSLCHLFSILAQIQTNKSPNFWETALELCQSSIGLCAIEDSDDESPVSLTTLRYFVLRLFISLQKQEKQVDELNKLWEDERESLYTEILEILFVSSNNTDTHPVGLTFELLERIFESFPINFAMDDSVSSRLIPLLTSKNIIGQRIATILLHEIIPKKQEDLIVNYELRAQKKHIVEDESGDEIEDDDEEIQISLELQSVIISPKTTEKFSYYWAWILVFDYFEGITYNMRNIYLNDLKAGGQVEIFLDNVFNYIRDKSRISKKLSAGNFQDIIRNYSLQGTSFENTEEEFDILCVHVLYLMLKNASSICQTWYLEIKDRQFSQFVGKFVESYISPLTIKDEIDRVKESLQNSGNDADGEITASMALREVKLSYTIDEQLLEMTVKIPTIYPLLSVQVEGPKRVGVREALWRSWLLASQRLITSRNGNIRESLELFKKNVTLHFSGFEECAICYAILDLDHSLPSKTCPTCSNKFHSGCLYKWFKSSDSNKCPLCRSAIKFRVGVGK